MNSAMLKAKLIFVKESEIQKNIDNGKIDQYDLLFLNDENDPKVGWVDRDKKPIVITDRDQIVEVATLPSVGKKSTLYIQGGANGYIWNGERYIDLFTSNLTFDSVSAMIAEMIASNDITVEGNYKDYTDEQVKALKDGDVRNNFESIQIINADETFEGSVLYKIKQALTPLLVRLSNHDDEIAKINGNDEVEGSVMYKIVQALAPLLLKLDGHDSDIEKINGDESVSGSTLNKIKQELDPVKADIGSVDNLKTVTKTVVGAINENYGEIKNVYEANKIALTQTQGTGAYSAVYTITQGTETIGTINIPKDMVVSSGSVEVNPTGYPEGTYIKLVLANVADPLYIDAGKLIDVYKAEENATQVQITVNQSTNVISARIVANSVGTTEIKDGAITTAKIGNKNVTLEKLSESLAASIALADSSIQQSDIDELSQTINKKIEDADKELDEKIDGINTTLIKKIEDADTALDEKIDDINTALNQKIDDTGEASVQESNAYTERRLTELMEEDVTMNILNEKLNQAIDRIVYSETEPFGQRTGDFWILNYD